MTSLNSILGLIALVTLLTGAISGIALAPQVSKPFSDVENLIQGLGVLCKKSVYRNDTINIDDLKALEVTVKSGKVMVGSGEPRIIVYTFRGVLCGSNLREPRWNLMVEDESIILELREGIVELYLQPGQLESLKVKVESGVIDLDLENLENLEVSEVEVSSGVAVISLSGLASIYNYTINIESGVANIDLDFKESHKGYLYADVASGQLNLDMKGDVDACLESSKITSGLATIDLPEKCTQDSLRVRVNVASGIASIG